MHTLFPATLLILAALTAPAVQAGASATTRIGNITLAVLDLTPQDGSNPGFTLDSFDSRLLVYADTRNTGGDVDRHQVAPAPHAAGVAQLAPGPADVRATPAQDRQQQTKPVPGQHPHAPITARVWYGQSSRQNTVSRCSRRSD